jgi:monothiol glutaredoxin
MDEATRVRIQELINQQRVVLFMKGTKRFPMCGFSAKVVGLLKETGTEFADVNILADEGLRSGLKEYSNWPTFPQLYVEGKLIGGCDIVSELHESGELPAVLRGSEQAASAS